MNNFTPIALVTGAIGGIGSITCKKLIDEGYLVVAICRNKPAEVLSQWLSDYDIDKDSVKFAFMDVTNNEECSLELDKLHKELGHFDVLVNNAGITRDTQFKKMDYSQWRDVIDTNLNSLFNVSQPVFNAMCERGYGRIINISSINGLKGQFGQTNYAAAKAGMIGFTKALAMEGARKGVTVNAVAPGYTKTPMVEELKPAVIESITAQIPVNRLAEPKEVAAAVAYLADKESGFITGETLSINGGQYMH
ncbi:acetoacetyl-CoA reductase [Marinomonas sp. MED121]|uniref:SDR family oxidoreductase n=1 Tax=Marinomonas sp. MED121 TaxID=314277 RepID=UPI000068FB8B|nr:SDR family oxidoreductase [Marinomonas sp. MED121]EAQ65071.1 acetoacetyl-CoA reductase [Marinomonas sp. MED121]